MPLEGREGAKNSESGLPTEEQKISRVSSNSLFHFQNPRNEGVNSVGAIKNKAPLLINQLKDAKKLIH
jgi:hypothetical protein